MSEVLNLLVVPFCGKKKKKRTRKGGVDIYTGTLPSHGVPPKWHRRGQRLTPETGSRRPKDSEWTPSGHFRGL